MDKSVIAAPTTQTNPGSIERLALIFSAMVLAGLCLWTWWPGILTWDSEDQLTQALSGSFTDWHPPIMAWIWSYLLALGPGGTPLFLLHVGLYWFSVSLVAVTLSQAGHHRLAWVTLAIAALPPFFALNGHVLKDIGMCVSLLGAFSVVFRYASRGRQLPWYALAFVLLLCAYGMLVRVNGVFAAAPLLVYMFVRTRGWSVLRVALLIAVITVVWIPLEGAINHRVLHAAVDYPIRALKAFDVAGTARFSGDLSVFPADARITADLLARCYTPVQWDPLDKGECTLLAKYPLQTREQIMYLARHPVAYLTHRIQNFNRALYALTPPTRPANPLPTRFPELERSSLEPMNERILAMSADVPLLSPLLTYLLSLSIVALSFTKRMRALPFGNAAFFLALSAFFYTSAFFLIGVASDYRYEYYPMLAAYMALVLYAAARTEQRWVVTMSEKLSAALLTLACLAVLGARATL